MKKKYLLKKIAGKTIYKAVFAAAFILGIQGSALAQTYCTPVYTTNCAFGDDIKDVTLNGANGTMISNLNTPCPTAGYMNYTTSTAANMTADLIQSNTYTGTVTTNYSAAYENVRIWIDFDNNGTFDNSESVATLANISNTSTGAISITIPMAASVGVRRMRVRLAYSTTPATMDPCASISYGECHDYKVNILPLAPPNNAGVGHVITPGATPFCSNSTKEVAVSVINLGANALTSANVSWSLDGVLQPALTMTTSLPNYKDSVVFVLGNVSFPTTAPRQIKAWTSMPNGVNDADHTDDTLNANVAATLEGVYVTISPQDTTICQGKEIVLDAGIFPADHFYIWNNGTLDRTRAVSQSGVYSVKVQNSLGCYDIDTVNVSVYPDPVVNSIAIIDNGDGTFTFNVIGAQNITSYTWDFGDGSQNVSQNGTPSQQFHTFSTAGEYTVTLTLRNQCGEIVVTKVVLIDGTTTGIDNISALQKEISVFPNPSKTTVTISNRANIKMKEISISNLMGQNVYLNSKVNAEQLDLNISAFAAGIYNVTIETEKGKVTKKMEVIK